MSNQIGQPGDVVAVRAERLTAFVARLFAAVGLPSEAADKIAHALVEADLEGVSSHGMMQVEMYLERMRRGSVSTAERAEIVLDRAAVAVLDAGHMLGHLAADQAMTLAIERSKQFGAGIVGVRHGFHFGVAGDYAAAAARRGCVGIATCNTRPLMPAPGGAERLVGNNPLAIALPSEGEPPLLVLDMAMSQAAFAKIRIAAATGQSIPLGWALSDDGSPTTDPAQAIAGMLLPAGGAKGFGLALMIDLMCGLLSGGASGDAVKPLYADMSEPYDCSYLFIAIDVAHFRDLDGFQREVAAAVARLHTSKRVPGSGAILAPGERKWMQRRSSNGVVRLPRRVFEALVRLAAEIGVETLDDIRDPSRA